MHFSDKTTIDCPRLVVWRSFADPTGWATWWGGRIERVDPGWELGAQVVWASGNPSKITHFVTAEHVTVTGSSNVRTTFLFEDTHDGKTIVTYSEDYNLARVSVTDPARRQTECNATVARLKRFVESSAKPFVSCPNNDAAAAPLYGEAVPPPSAQSSKEGCAPGPIANHQKLIVRLMIIFGLVEATLLGCFVWPSLYKSRVDNLGMFGEQTIRENRFTGTQEIYGDGKWQRIEVSEGKITIPANTQLVVGGAEPGFGGSFLVAAFIVGVGVVEVVLIILWLGSASTVRAPVNRPVVYSRRCDKCGQAYRLEDYDPAAEHIFCSRCKIELPRSGQNK